MNSIKIIKFISGAVVASLVLTTGFTSLAAKRGEASSGASKHVASQSGVNPGKGPCKGVGKGGHLKSILGEMVKDGTLSQSEADKITAYKKEKQETMKAEMDKIKNMTSEERGKYISTKKTEHEDFLVELVDKGIITQTKADAIKIKMEQKRQEMKSAKLKEMKSQINTLVYKGKINQTQADKVIEYMNQNMGKSKIEKSNIDQAEKDKIKNMTNEERKAYFEKMRGEKGCFLKELVDNGTLTQEQADAVRDSIFNQHRKGLKGK